MKIKLKDNLHLNSDIMPTHISYRQETNLYEYLRSPIDNPDAPYKRSDIKMELKLSNFRK